MIVASCAFDIGCTRTPSRGELAPWDRYTARVHAVALLRSDAVFCHESAAALLGMPLFGEPRDVHIFDMSSPTTHRVGDVVHHTSRIRPPVLALDGLNMTSPSATAVALARALPPAFGLAVVDAAVSPRQLALTDVAHLRACLESQVDPRGIRRVTWVLDHTDAAAEAPSESVSRAVIGWLGFDPPETQREFIVDGKRYRTDFFWQSADVVGEVDGDSKYGGDNVMDGRLTLRREKQREDALRRVTRSVVRWDWAAALRVGPLRRVLMGAGVQRVAPEHPGMLATLRSNPRSLRPRD